MAWKQRQDGHGLGVASEKSVIALNWNSLFLKKVGFLCWLLA
jgi:hypothetical protein